MQKIMVFSWHVILCLQSQFFYAHNHFFLCGIHFFLHLENVLRHTSVKIILSQMGRSSHCLLLALHLNNNGFSKIHTLTCLYKIEGKLSFVSQRQ